MIKALAYLYKNLRLHSKNCGSGSFRTLKAAAINIHPKCVLNVIGTPVLGAGKSASCTPRAYQADKTH